MSDAYVFESWSVENPLRAVDVVMNEPGRWTKRKQRRLRVKVNACRREVRRLRRRIDRDMRRLAGA